MRVLAPQLAPLVLPGSSEGIAGAAWSIQATGVLGFWGGDEGQDSSSMVEGRSFLCLEVERVALDGMAGGYVVETPSYS